MNTTRAISPAQLRTLLLQACEVIQSKEHELNALDAAVGDGDHGITMRVGFKAISNYLQGAPQDLGVDAILGNAGKTFMRSTGGAIGVILGRGLSAGGTALAGAVELGPAELNSCFSGMEKAVTETGKAKPGDRTLLDPLHAATQALEAAPAGASSAEVLAIAAAAAESAAQATATMLCRIGRASRLGDRVLGHPDPGAVSFALLVRALADGAARINTGPVVLHSQRS